MAITSLLVLAAVPALRAEAPALPGSALLPLPATQGGSAGHEGGDCCGDPESAWRHLVGDLHAEYDAKGRIAGFRRVASPGSAPASSTPPSERPWKSDTSSETSGAGWMNEKQAVRAAGSSSGSGRRLMASRVSGGRETLVWGNEGLDTEGTGGERHKEELANSVSAPLRDLLFLTMGSQDDLDAIAGEILAAHGQGRRVVARAAAAADPSWIEDHGTRLRALRDIHGVLPDFLEITAHGLSTKEAVDAYLAAAGELAMEFPSVRVGGLGPDVGAGAVTASEAVALLAALLDRTTATGTPLAFLSWQEDAAAGSTLAAALQGELAARGLAGAVELVVELH